MNINPITYNTLVYYSAMYAIEHNNKALINVLNVLQKDKVQKEIMYDILSECRARLANPKVARFYEQLKKGINYDEFRPTEV